MNLYLCYTLSKNHDCSFTFHQQLLAKTLCFALFLILYTIEKVFGVVGFYELTFISMQRLFIPIPMRIPLSYEEQEEEGKGEVKEKNE